MNPVLPTRCLGCRLRIPVWHDRPHLRLLVDGDGDGASRKEAGKC